MTIFDTMSEPLPRRLRDGLERLALVLRTEQWDAASAIGLTPAQLHILSFLAGRADNGCKVKDITRHLGVSQPSATDSVTALERKGLVAKRASIADARAVTVAITADGLAAVKAASTALTASEQALAALPVAEQASMLLHLMSVIRSLQIAGAISEQRMCATCRHFRPHAYPGAPHPHHCAFVNAAFGTGHLRLDCREHELADPASRTAIWRALSEGSAPLQASN